MTNKSHLTAISRKKLPVPVRMLLSSGLVRGHVLDYGCGKCKELNDTVIKTTPGVKSIDSYDPYYEPNGIIQPNSEEGWYNVILCTYVLCTLPSIEEQYILKDIQRLLRKNGIAYISVRADEPKGGYGFSAKGTFQRNVQLERLPLMWDNRNYRIYVLTGNSKP